MLFRSDDIVYNANAVGKLGQILSLAQDKDGAIWGVNNGSGVFCIKDSGKGKELSFYTLQRKNGLIDNVLTICVDHSNRL